MKDIVFVTAYRDLQREKWSHYIVPREHYIQRFVELTKKIEYELEVYVEPHVLKILQDYAFPSHIYFNTWDNVETFFDKYFEQEEAISKDKSFLNTLPRHIQYSPKLHADYTLVNHSKVNFLADVKSRKPDYRYYGWIDFAYYLMWNIDLPKDVDVYSLDVKKISVHSKNPIPDFLTVTDLLHFPHEYITGGSYLIPNDIVYPIEKIYENKLKQYYAMGIIDDDQSIWTQLYNDNPDMFELHIHPTMHGLFKKIKKIPNIIE
jgi:hypothetical protein